MTDVTLIRGDGIGPEIAEAARRCVDATGAEINWDVCEAGIDIMKTAGTPLPDETLASIKKNENAGATSTIINNGLGSFDFNITMSLEKLTV